jgi:mycothiol synthase
MERVDEAERLSHVAGPSIFEWLAHQDGIDLAGDTLVGVDDDGEIRVDAGVWGDGGTGERSRVRFWVDTDPEFTSLRPFLIAWSEARARQRLDVATAPERVIRTSVEEHRTELRSALEHAGYEEARAFLVMRRGLESIPGVGEFDGVSVEPWTEQRDESTRIANNESFADHWGSAPMNTARWRGIFAESKMFRPDLSFLALADDRVVSFCLVEVDGEEATRSGITEGYIRSVGTVRSHRRRGIASDLVVRTMRAAAAAGCDRVALDVDETSATGAVDLYQGLGFEIAERSIQYAKYVSGQSA